MHEEADDSEPEAFNRPGRRAFSRRHPSTSVPISDAARRFSEEVIMRRPRGGLTSHIAPDISRLAERYSSRLPGTLEREPGPTMLGKRGDRWC